MGTGYKARRHTMFELFRGATISRGRAWKKPHLVPLGTPHRRKRCDVQRLAVGRAATPGIGRRLHRATGPSRPASNLHRDCQVLEGSLKNSNGTRREINWLLRAERLESRKELCSWAEPTT